MVVRKTVVIREAIEADGFGKACDPITRVVAVAGKFWQDTGPIAD